VILLALLAGYPIYALVAAFTSFTLLPDTKWEIIALVGLTALAVVGKAMDQASEAAAERGDPAALKYRRAWGLDRDSDDYWGLDRDSDDEVGMLGSLRGRD
jgi:hypothetical protein